VALYAQLYWWRAWQDRKLAAAGGGVPLAPSAGIGAAGTTGANSAAWAAADGVAEAEPAADPPVAG
jgi:hypothetical protein